ncbi:MAG: citrate synthase [Candidatus Poribacteria bacterium]|nr:citrate synthase [Candidatus Poribacteria bacterium]
MANVISGLQDVALTESKICRIDGSAGHLIYRGYDIRDLAQNATFEETAYLLWSGDLPTRPQLNALNAQLAAERGIDENAYRLIASYPKTAPPMDALRTCVSLLASADAEMEDNSNEANLRKAIRLTAKFPTILAAVYRHSNDQEPIPPLKDGSSAANFLYMLSGEKPDPFVARTLDAALTLHAEHGMNASTFSARVTCATLSDMYAAVTSALGTLKGPLHGGANAIVRAMLEEIEAPENAERYVKETLAGDRVVPGLAPKRIPGFGHRVYTSYDPRAAVLHEMSETLGKRAGETVWVDISEAVVEACEKEGLNEKGVYPNVDFFSASAYTTMGIDVPLFTPVFALARITGWTAHIIEQHNDNRLIRPKAIYVGEEGRVVQPIEER